MGPFRDQTNVLRSILIWVYGIHVNSWLSCAGGGNPFRCLGQVCFALHAGPCLYVHRPKINQSWLRIHGIIGWAMPGDDWMTARLPSNPERMVPGAPVLLEPCLAIQHKMTGRPKEELCESRENGENAGQEQLWLLLGACVFPAFLVLPLASSYQLILNKMQIA